MDRMPRATPANDGGASSWQQPHGEDGSAGGSGWDSGGYAYTPSPRSPYPTAPQAGGSGWEGGRSSWDGGEAGWNGSSDDYREFFYGEGTEPPVRKRRRGCGCGWGCSSFLAVVLVVALVFAQFPQLVPSSDILRGTQIDQLEEWLEDAFDIELPQPDEDALQAIYSQESQVDSSYLAESPDTSLSSVAGATEYYRGALDEHAQTVYDALEEGILAHEDRISLPFGTTEDELQTCWQFVLYDHPEVFYLPDDAHVTYWQVGGQVDYLEPQYKYDADTASQMSAQYEQLAADLPLLADTQAQTMRNICDYVADSTDYVDSDNDQSIDSVFTNGQSVCAGYAKAVQYLALRHGIPCVYITGTAADFLGTGGRHAWLAASIDGEVRYYDPTWYDQRGFHATQFIDMDLVDISADHTADYPQLLPR